MKRILPCLLTALLLSSLFACGGEENGTSQPNAEQSTPSVSTPEQSTAPTYSVPEQSTTPSSTSSQPEDESEMVYLLTKETQTKGDEAFSYTLETVYVYDENYNLVSKTTTMWYSVNGEITLVEETLEETYSYAYEENIEIVTVVRDDDIIVRTKVCDDKGNMLSYSSVRNGVEISRSESIYDENGNRLQMTDSYGDTVQVYTYTYDEQGNLLTQSYLDLNGDPTVIESIYEDGVHVADVRKVNGEVTETTEYHWENETCTAKTYDADGNLILTSVFAGNRMLSRVITDADGAEIRAWYYEYDEHGNQIRVEERYNGKTTTVTEYEYTAVPALDNDDLH